jgi:Raf kinase inhibitor-like YbhB/YbcL family protein
MVNVRTGREQSKLAAGLAFALLFGAGLGACGKNPALQETSANEGSERGNPMGFELSSPSFHASDAIPRKFTCDGEDVSPTLAWSAAPAGTASLCLIMDDPDAPAGTWVHWVLYDLPGATTNLAENVPKERELAGGARQGRNSFGRIGYGGPCPPPGPPHRYFIRLYALDTKTNLKPGATRAEVDRATKGHILAQAELMGRYKR